MKSKNIQIDVDLDARNFPENIVMRADDNPTGADVSCRAMILAMWDSHNKDTLRLDLWTKKMTRDEMKIFFHQTLTTMADTLQRSIDDERIAGDLRDFCDHFAEKMEIASPDKKGR